MLNSFTSLEQADTPSAATLTHTSDDPGSATAETIVTVQQVGKRYHLYAQPQDRLKQALFWRLGRNYAREFWALRNVSFEVRRGECFGIIGRNGSGKSTLLQIICGILTPTTGEVHIAGRVAALLELGSGFNPEFTGRENIFVNGAILGLSREEVERRFDAIAAFADIGAFLDQPVKLYSSGMFVRLAFALVTSVDADVLVVDEALAVGDIFFRQKCYRQLELLRERGVSIILVSHSMMDVEQYCQRGMLLNKGQVILEGTASEVVKRYYLIEQEMRSASLAAQPRPPVATPVTEQSPVSSTDEFWPAREAFLDLSAVSQVSNGEARCTGVSLCDDSGRSCQVFQQGATASFFYEFEVLQDIEVPLGGVVLQNDHGVIVHGKGTLEYGSQVPMFVVQGSRIRFRQDIQLEIAVGEYTFEVGLASMARYDYEHRADYRFGELRTKFIRLCHLPGVSRFVVTWRQNGWPVQQLHHGVANLPGKGRVTVLRLGESAKEA